MFDLLAINFGARLKEIRKSRNLTQAQLAETIDVEEASISRIERGQRFPQKENLVKLAKALNTEIKEFFDFRYQKLKANILTKLENANLNDLQYYNKMIDTYLEAQCNK